MWANNRHDDPSRFRTALVADDEYQVFVDVPWKRQAPDELADAVVALLKQDPPGWKAEWLPMTHGIDTPPRLAGRRWRRWRDPYRSR